MTYLDYSSLMLPLLMYLTCLIIHNSLLILIIYDIQHVLTTFCICYTHGGFGSLGQLNHSAYLDHAHITLQPLIYIVCLFMPSHPAKLDHISQEAYILVTFINHHNHRCLLSMWERVIESWSCNSCLPNAIVYGRSGLDLASMPC